MARARSLPLDCQSSASVSATAKTPTDRIIHTAYALNAAFQLLPRHHATPQSAQGTLHAALLGGMGESIAPSTTTVRHEACLKVPAVRHHLRQTRWRQCSRGHASPHRLAPKQRPKSKLWRSLNDSRSAMHCSTHRSAPQHTPRKPPGKGPAGAMHGQVHGGLINNAQCRDNDHGLAPNSAPLPKPAVRPWRGQPHQGHQALPTMLHTTALRLSTDTANLPPGVAVRLELPPDIDRTPQIRKPPALPKQDTMALPPKSC